jgi:Zn-finger domain-containing protein
MDTSERIAKMEAQVESLKEDVSELKDDVKELHSRITTGNREILEKIDSMESKLDYRMRESSESATLQHNRMQNELKHDIQAVSDRVTNLERWRFMIAGGAIALGYLISHLEVFSKIFSFR